MSWANQYVGIPFHWTGASRDGASCWGLVKLVMSERYGIEFPLHEGISRSVKAGMSADPELYVKDGLERGFEQIPLGEEREGDILHLWTFWNGRKMPLHAGVVVKPGRVLHTEIGVESIISDYRDRKFAWRLIGAYRHA